MASYDGNAIFGRSVSVTMAQAPSAMGYSAFWGIGGVYSTYGGSRGRTFTVKGVLFGASGGDLWNNVALLLSYDDGIARDLVDTAGNSWPQVVFKSCELADKYYFGLGGVLLPYTATFEGRL